MRERQRSERTLVDLMMHEAEVAAVYVAEPKAKYEATDSEGLHLRDGLWRHVLQFLESGTKLGRPFRAANPGVPWDLVHELRQEMVHNYPEVSADRVRAFALEEMPRMVRLFRRARFPSNPAS